MPRYAVDVTPNGRTLVSLVLLMISAAAHTAGDLNVAEAPWSNIEQDAAIADADFACKHLETVSARIQEEAEGVFSASAAAIEAHDRSLALLNACASPDALEEARSLFFSGSALAEQAGYRYSNARLDKEIFEGMKQRLSTGQERLEALRAMLEENRGTSQPTDDPTLSETAATAEDAIAAKKAEFAGCQAIDLPDESFKAMQATLDKLPATASWRTATNSLASQCFARLNIPGDFEALKENDDTRGDYAGFDSDPGNLDPNRAATVSTELAGNRSSGPAGLERRAENAGGRPGFPIDRTYTFDPIEAERRERERAREVERIFNARYRAWRYRYRKY